MNSQTWVFSGGRFLAGGYLPLDALAVRYGMSIFETVAIYRGRALLLDGHLERLQAAAAAAKFPIDSALLAALREFLAMTSPGSGVVRAYVGAGAGSLLAPPAEYPCWLHFEPCEIAGTIAAPDFRIQSSSIPYTPALPGIKTANYWLNVLALRNAHAAACNEALFFNGRNELVSASMANIFLMIDGQLVTPGLDSGARNGVVREWVMARAPCAEVCMSRQDVARAAACFLTNSRLGVQEVDSVDGRGLERSKIGRALAAEYRREILDGHGG